MTTTYRVLSSFTYNDSTEEYTFYTSLDEMFYAYSDNDYPQNNSSIEVS